MKMKNTRFMEIKNYLLSINYGCAGVCSIEARRRLNCEKSKYLGNTIV